MTGMDYKKMCRLFLVVLTIGIVSASVLLTFCLTVDEQSSVLYAHLFVADFFIFVLIPAFGLGISGALYREKEFKRTGKWPPRQGIVSFLFDK